MAKTTKTFKVLQNSKLNIRMADFQKDTLDARAKLAGLPTSLYVRQELNLPETPSAEWLLQHGYGPEAADAAETEGHSGGIEGEDPEPSKRKGKKKKGKGKKHKKRNQAEAAAKASSLVTNDPAVLAAILKGAQA